MTDTDNVTPIDIKTARRLESLSITDIKAELAALEMVLPPSTAIESFLWLSQRVLELRQELERRGKS